MKRVMIFLMLCAGLMMPVLAAEGEWHRGFLDDILSAGYEGAVEKALASGVSSVEIGAVSSKLGYSGLYVMAVAYRVSERLGLDAGAGLEAMLRMDFAAGVERAQVIAMAESDMGDAIASETIYIPGSNEVRLNYARFFGDPELGAEDEENQGLGFGDAPELGMGDVTMGSVGYSTGGNIDISVSQATP